MIRLNYIQNVDHTYYKFANKLGDQPDYVEFDGL